ncbi:protein stum homolog isoform X2 [Tubulanus polymorphus]|uniref:protein stum homolog isoform X2 n=1 Tax=Tubulanus polymorphus TaxID=672921 RepID=UPI003DA29F96
MAYSNKDREKIEITITSEPTAAEEIPLTTNVGGVNSDGNPPRKTSRNSLQPPQPLGQTSGGYEIVTVEEKHGALHNAIPCMPLPLAVVCCILNIGIPGLGTIISSFSVFCCGSSRIQSKWRAFGLNLLAGFLQMITFCVIVGWIWSILWGRTFIELSLMEKMKRENSL